LTIATTTTEVAGPYFDDLRVGDRFDDAPGLTLTSGHAALHQAILGDRLRFPLDAGLCARALGAAAPLAHPGLVWDVAIGQSTLATGRVIANLFYRGLVLHRTPLIGDTLRTKVEVVALRRNRPRPDRAPTGLAVLRVATTDQEARRVLDFHRCAMLPVREPAPEDGPADELDRFDAELDPVALRSSIGGWNLGALGGLGGSPRFRDLLPGQTWRLAAGDAVTSAPELARLTLNIAHAHHDSAANPTGRRLVYGGHTIGIAAAQLTRALPSLLTIVAWHSCDHLGPVFEGDTLASEVELERTEPLPDGGGLLHLRSRVRSRRTSGEEADVLDWRLVAVMA